ncbi:MAG: hypothetical protein HC840_00065 [Leptolyngbyaceae cyanobacterium RM2_2_4]|nr:hypothetical protein [Leptolyngbyaceae cyanobacterium RM2_2_4]
MIQIPAHLQLDFDSLSGAQKNAFGQLATWGAAGGPGNIIISDAAFERIFNQVKRMGESPDLPAEPDRSVNHDWNFKFK